MAQKVQVTLVDDLDGSEAVETIQFSFDGQEYEIDLSKKNAAALRKMFTPYAESARRAALRRPVRARRGKGPRRTGRNAEIRQWARETGVAVPDRGRIPHAVVEQFEAVPEAKFSAAR